MRVISSKINRKNLIINEIMLSHLIQQIPLIIKIKPKIPICLNFFHCLTGLLNFQKFKILAFGPNVKFIFSQVSIEQIAVILKNEIVVCGPQ